MNKDKDKNKSKPSRNLDKRRRDTRMNKDKDKNKSKPSRPWEALAAKWQAQAAADKAAGYTDLANLEARTARLLAQVMTPPAPRR